MKRFLDNINLTDEIEEISMMDLRKHPGEIMTAVYCGKTYIIKRKGRPLGMLVHIPKDKMATPGGNLSIAIDSGGNISYKVDKVEL